MDIKLENQKKKNKSLINLIGLSQTKSFASAHKFVAGQLLLEAPTRHKFRGWEQQVSFTFRILGGVVVGRDRGSGFPKASFVGQHVRLTRFGL